METAGASDVLRDLGRPDSDVCLVVGREAKGHLWSEHLAALAVERQAIDSGERIGRNVGARPLDRIAVVIVMSRFDHHEMKELCRRRFRDVLL